MAASHVKPKLRLLPEPRWQAQKSVLRDCSSLGNRSTCPVDSDGPQEALPDRLGASTVRGSVRTGEHRHVWRREAIAMPRPFPVDGTPGDGERAVHVRAVPTPAGAPRSWHEVAIPGESERAKSTVQPGTTCGSRQGSPQPMAQTPCSSSGSARRSLFMPAEGCTERVPVLRYADAKPDDGAATVSTPSLISSSCHHQAVRPGRVAR